MNLKIKKNIIRCEKEELLIFERQQNNDECIFY